MNYFNEQFLEQMKHLLGDEYDEFIESLNRKNEKSIYINSNKIGVEHFKKIVDFSISPISYEPNGCYVNEEKLGRHALHHAGAFYMQEPSAMFTVNAYKFRGDEYVLDMCAAPGGKSIQIANRIPNGLLVSNEINKKRSDILYSNIERMGLRNVIITNDTPERIANAYANCFDVCLVDAPCSGEGMFRKGEDMVGNWNIGLNEQCAARQIDILEHANKVLKNNGILIYSTCTYSKLENEDVISAFMQKHNYKLLNIEENFTRGVNMPEAVRLYPHKVKGEGQFVAVLQKMEENALIPEAKLPFKVHIKSKEFLKQEFNLSLNPVEFKNFSYFVLDLNMIKRNVNYVSLGVKLLDLSSKDIVPFHNLFTAFGNEIPLKLHYNFNSAETVRYLRGETFETDLKDGYGAFLIENCAVGGFKISKGKFKNYYPKGLRNF